MLAATEGFPASALEDAATDALASSTSAAALAAREARRARGFTAAAGAAGADAAFASTAADVDGITGRTGADDGAKGTGEPRGPVTDMAAAVEVPLLLALATLNADS